MKILLQTFFKWSIKKIKTKLSPKKKEIELPDFLYEHNGKIFSGVHGDSDVTE